MGVNELIKIGDYLKKIRLDNNLTQEEFAKKLNLKRSTYSNYEKNTREPSKEILEKLSKEFNVDLLELITSFPTVKIDEEIKPSTSTDDAFGKFLTSSLIDVKGEAKQIPALLPEDYDYLLNHCFSFINEFYKYRYINKNITTLSEKDDINNKFPINGCLNRWVNNSLDNLK